MAEHHPRRTLVLLAVLFLAPVLLAWVAFRTVDWWGAEPTANYGDLIHPARPLQEMVLAQVDGTPLALDDLRGKWTLVYFNTPDCDEACRQALYKMRQTRLALGKEMNRVQRLLIVSDTLPPTTREFLQREHRDLEVGFADPQTLGRLAVQFAEEAEPPAPEGQRIYLVDPLGNLMMSYDVRFEMKGMFKDLERLLKASRIG